MKCEKCNSEMVYFREGSSCGWTCPNCNWGMVTTYLDPIELDQQLYSIKLSAVDAPKAEIIKYFSKIKGCNFIVGKAMLSTGATLDDLKAPEVKKIITELGKMGIGYDISPEFPYYD